MTLEEFVLLQNLDLAEVILKSTNLNLQAITKYLRLNVVLCKVENYGKSLISVFQEFFASINKIFILAVTLITRLLFYDV